MLRLQRRLKTFYSQQKHAECARSGQNDPSKYANHRKYRKCGDVFWCREVIDSPYLYRIRFFAFLHDPVPSKYEIISTCQILSLQCDRMFSHLWNISFVLSYNSASLGACGNRSSTSLSISRPSKNISELLHDSSELAMRPTGDLRYLYQLVQVVRLTVFIKWYQEVT